MINNKIKIIEKNSEPVGGIVYNNKKQGLKSSTYPEGIKDAYKCSGCCICFLECPIYEDSLCESAGAKGKMEAIKLWDSGYIQLEDIQNVFELCTLCKRCENVCTQEIKISKLIRNIRKCLVQNNISNQISNGIKECILQKGHPYRKESSSFKRIPKWYENNDKETALWAGCTTRHMGLLDQWLKLFIDLKYCPTLLMDEKCCGSVLKNFGYDSEFKNVMRTNVHDLSTFKRIITLCPSCYTTFKNEFKTKEIIFITEFLNEYRKKLHISKFFEEPLMLFEPCHLKNYEPWMDAVSVLQEILEKDKIKYFKSGDLYGAKCCGGGGGILATHSDISRDRISRLVNNAQKLHNIKTVVTMCPFCHNAFNRINSTNIKVLNLGAVLCV